MKKSIVFFFVVIITLVSLVTIPASATRTIDMLNHYQDYKGNVYDETNENLDLHPKYNIDDNGTHYILTRFDDILTLEKSLGAYTFYPDKISLKLNFTPAQLNSRSTTESSNWYISLPKSLTRTQFVWDNKKPVVYNESGDFLNNRNFWYANENEMTRFYYNQTARTFGANSKYVIFEFNSYEISNATQAWWEQTNLVTNGSRVSGSWLTVNLRNDSTLNMTGLMMYLSFDETVGITTRNVNNESGLPNTTNQGTWNGYTSINSTTGHIGNALLFDGVNDYVDAGNDSSLNFGSSNDFSFGVWIKTGMAGQGKILRKMDFVNYYGYSIDVRDNGNLFLDFRGTGARSYKQYLTAVSDNNWHHIMVTNNRLGGIANLYVDSVYVGQQDVSTVGNINTPANLYLGMEWDGVGYYFFNGSIDEVSIWNHALSSDEVNASYNASMRTHAMPYWTQINATTGHVFTNMTATMKYYNNQILANASLYARRNGTVGWTLIASNITNGTTYNIPTDIRLNSMDFAVELKSNGSVITFLEKLVLNETYVHVYPTPVPNCGVRTITDNTNLAPTIHPDIPGTNERLNGTTYYNNDSEIELLVFAHANTVSQVAGTFVYINNTMVMAQSGRPLGAAEASYRGIPITIPKGSTYRVEFVDYHHYEWREYKKDLDISGCNYPENNDSLNSVIMSLSFVIGFLVALIVCLICSKRRNR